MNYRTIGPLVELCNYKSSMHESSCQSKKAGDGNLELELW